MRALKGWADAQTSRARCRIWPTEAGSRRCGRNRARGAHSADRRDPAGDPAGSEPPAGRRLPAARPGPQARRPDDVPGPRAADQDRRGRLRDPRRRVRRVRPGELRDVARGVDAAGRAGRSAGAGLRRRDLRKGTGPRARPRRGGGVVREGGGAEVRPRPDEPGLPLRAGTRGREGPAQGPESLPRGVGNQGRQPDLHFRGHRGAQRDAAHDRRPDRGARDPERRGRPPQERGRGQPVAAFVSACRVEPGPGRSADARAAGRGTARPDRCRPCARRGAKKARG